MKNLAIDDSDVRCAATDEAGEAILTPEALGFVAALSRRFAARVDGVLAQRIERRSSKVPLGFLPETRVVSEAEWKIAPVPDDLVKRVVEITGPVDRKMVINALNSGADVFMADFEDACSPTWSNVIQGQVNLRDAVRREIEYDDPASGKAYRLGEQLAVLMVRPRGLHLSERHLVVDDRPVPAPLVDFGLYFFHNAEALRDRGTGPYFYLPKIESHHEARLWDDIFVFAQSRLGIPRGTIKATVLIETLPAAFEMDEILFALREHSAGLNCGRWDYIFSFIKCFRNDPEAVFPDRSQVTMEQPCMRAYTQLAIQTCHRRGAHAMGGMAAFIPIKNDPAANQAAFDKVHEDKIREAKDGHDGTWVAHPGLVPVARKAFEQYLEGPNQLGRIRDDLTVSREDLLAIPGGTRTEDGLRLNIRVGIQYLAAWLRGQGAVPLYHLMEDAATAEISRTQVWQWVHHQASLEDGRTVTPALVEDIIAEEMTSLAAALGEDRFGAGHYDDARRLFTQWCTEQQLTEFLTIAAYDQLEA